MVSLRSALLSISLFLIALLPSEALTREPPREVPISRQQIQLSYAPLTKQVSPAVVNIYTSRRVKQFARSALFNDPIFKHFFGNKGLFGNLPQRERTERSLGSGVVIGADGTIVTSHHVIQGSEQVTVVLSDRREFEAEILLSDEKSDLALLKINAGGEALPYLALRDSDTLEVGDLVLAVGNPFGVGQTVTSGIISALARSTLQGVADYQFFIQTDAAINPGNSGGALVDMQGRLIGVNTAIYSTSGASNGIGFAIPANMVRTVLANAQSGNRQVVRPWLGVSVQSVTSDIAESLGMNRPKGVILKEVAKGSPADRAGLQVGDIILMINGYDVDDEQGMMFRTAIIPLNQKAVFHVWRSGKRFDREVMMIAPPEEPKRDQRTFQGAHPLHGVTVANLSPAVAVEIGISTSERGVIVMDGSASRLMERGDILDELNGAKIHSAAQLEQMLQQNIQRWKLVFYRNGQRMQVMIR